MMHRPRPIIINVAYWKKMHEFMSHGNLQLYRYFILASVDSVGYRIHAPAGP